jgi:hypothetical protein
MALAGLLPVGLLLLLTATIHATRRDATYVTCMASMIRPVVDEVV